MTTHDPERGERPASSGSSRFVLTDWDFERFRALIYKEIGIDMSPIKKDLLSGRLSKRLRELGIRSFREYYRRVSEGDSEERVHFFNLVSTNETHFFRQPSQFQFLEERVIPTWLDEAAAGRRSRRIDVWSAACSTGEEPFSLAMSLMYHLPKEAGWTVRILATDISTRVLDQANEAIWPLAKAEEIPDKYLKSFMLKGANTQADKIKAGLQLRSAIEFRRLNLVSDPFPASHPFDLVFCRNVLIYFDLVGKKRVVERLIEVLKPNGYLFLGQVENLHGITDAARSVVPTIYRRAEPISPDQADVREGRFRRA